LTAANTFKIAAFSDLHTGEDEDSFGIEQDVKTRRMFRHVLNAEHPDFVVLNGDLTTGENTYRENSSKYIDIVTGPLIEGGYRWASTYGNHDSKFNLSRESMLQEEQKHDLCYTQHGPPDQTDGVTNYHIPIWPASKPPLQRREKPVAILYFLDSRGGVAYQSDPANNDNIPNWVSPRTASWFRNTAASNKARWGTLPSLAFVHIPIKAHEDAQRSAKVSGPHYPGLNADVPVAVQGYGNVGGGVYAGQDVPFMQALLDTEGLHSVYSGHDHGDSWCALWSDTTNPRAPASNGGLDGDAYASNGRPFLCFTKHSGFGGYGDWRRGVRQIELRFDGQGGVSVRTWVRMQFREEGDVVFPQVVTNVTLNATYGEDVYGTESGGYRP